MAPVSKLHPRPVVVPARPRDEVKKVADKPKLSVVAANTTATSDPATKTESKVVNRTVNPALEAQNRYRQQQIQSSLTAPTTPATDAEIDKARQDSRQILSPRNAKPVPDSVDTEREYVSDPPSPNVLSKRADLDAVKAQTETNTRAVETKLSRMSPEDQQRYRDLDQRLGDDHDSRLSMQTMLLEDRLTPNTMKELQALDDAPKAANLEGSRKGRLMRETLREIASPDRIEQGGGTCVPTSATIDLAERDPAEYTRLVRGLASPEGTVTTKSGAVLKREANTRTEDGVQRTISQRLLEPAVMEAANGDALDYDAKTDRHYRKVLDADGNPVIDPKTKKPKLESVGSGLDAAATERAFELLNGTDYSQITPQVEKRPRVLVETPPGLADRPRDVLDGTSPLDRVDTVKASSLDQIEEAVNKGQTVPAGIRMKHADGTQGGHQILVTKVYESDGVKYVEYRNPWGDTERMERGAFERRLMDAQVERRLA